MTKKFITAEIDLINTKMAELIGSGKHTMKAEVRILTDNIIALREWADEEDDEINPDMCAVYLTSGEFFILYKPYAEVVEILEWY
jgi:hypothetical protein